jgi:flagellar basal-body rod protein FlgC
MEIRYLSGMGISQSGLTAQRRQMDVAAENLANAYTTRTETGDPYRRQAVSFESTPVDGPRGPGSGRTPGIELPETEPAPLSSTNSAHMDRRPVVSTPLAPIQPPKGVAAKVTEDASEFPTVYDPTHPDADGEGNVRLPNVDAAQELVTMMVAARAYEANVAALGAARSMAEAALDLSR